MGPRSKVPLFQRALLNNAVFVFKRGHVAPRAILGGSQNVLFALPIQNLAVPTSLPRGKIRRLKCPFSAVHSARCSKRLSTKLAPIKSRGYQVYLKHTWVSTFTFIMSDMFSETYNCFVFGQKMMIFFFFFLKQIYT